MIHILTIVFILFIIVGYKFYFKPKAEKQRYVKLLKSLGYTVYEQPFSFLGISMIDEFIKGEKLHKDGMYYDRTIYPHFDVVLANIFDKVQIILVHPDLIKEFYSGTKPYKYLKLQTLLSGVKAVLGEGIVLSEGETWKNKRKLLSKVFNFDLIKENIPKIVDICKRCYDDFDQTYKTSQGKFKYSTLSLSARIFNGVMMRCFFGVDRVAEKIKGQDYQQFVVETMSNAAEISLNPLLLIFGKFAWKMGLTKTIREVKESINIMRTISKCIFKQRTEQALASPKKQKCTDIIEALVQEKLSNKQDFSYTDQELLDQFQTFLIAGTDTTTRFFTMIIYYIGRNPEVHRKLRQEINSVIKSDVDITHENLKKLNYIDWIQYQTTRCYGPANGVFQRRAVEDDYLKNIPIVKDTIVSTQPRGSHFSQKYFKNPNEFRPERWQSECEGIHPFAFIGFSTGIRSCIGKQLALLQSKIALVKFIMRYETIEVPEQVTLKVKFMFEAEPFDVVLTKSNDPQ